MKIVGVSEQIYYHRKKRVAKAQTEGEVVVKKAAVGRPVPGQSFTVTGVPHSDEQISEWLSEAASDKENGVYGYRKLTLLLRRTYDLVINKKKVYRLLKEMDLLHPQRRKQSSFPRKMACNRTITASNELWEMDVKYGYIAGEQRFFFLLCVIDVLDRAIIEFHFGLSCEGKHAAALIERALWKRELLSKENRPVIRTDNGPQFISKVFGEACQTHRSEHERIPPKTPNKNAHIESFHSVLEAECLQRQEFMSYQEAYEVVSQYIGFYNDRRMHGSLYDLAPEQYRVAMAAGEVKPLIVKV